MADFIQLDFESPGTRRVEHDIEFDDQSDEQYARWAFTQFCSELEKNVKNRQRIRAEHKAYEERSSSTETAREERSHTPS